MRGASPTAPSIISPSSPDYRTKGQSFEKKHFHILPQLQAKRADFLTVMLTGTLSPHRSFASPEEEIPEPLGSKEGDVIKSESSSEASQKSPERSQEAAASTLMAEDQRGPREHASVADADPDLEDVSKTLVLFSPGDTRKSPSGADHVLDGELATPCTLTSHNEQAVQLESSETGCLSPALRSDLKPTLPIAPASPPFTKVERTFVHIAETSHLNIMPSNGHCIKDSNCENTKSSAGNYSCEVDVGPKIQECPEVFIPENNLPAERHLSTKNGPITVSESPKLIQEPKVPAEAHDFLQDHEKQQLNSEKSSTVQATRQESQAPSLSHSRSRIPVLISEEKSGSEESTSFSAWLQRRTRNPDLARFLVQKQQNRWMRRRVPSGASSLSSGDDEQRRASSSEEDTHISQESRRNIFVQVTEKHRSKDTKSRIPRPVTSFKRSSAAATPLPVADPNPTKQAPFLMNGIPKFGLSTHRKNKLSFPRSSSSCPRPTSTPGPSSSPRRLPFVPIRTRRSLSSAHYRTDSPSPQRLYPTRQPLSVRAPTVPMLLPRPAGTMRRSTSQEATTQTFSCTIPVKNKPKPNGTTQGLPNAREKVKSSR